MELRGASFEKLKAAFDWSDPKTRTDLQGRPPGLFYVQPGHYFVISDNPTASSDSRDWGVLPRAFLQGHASFRYFPFERAGWLSRRMAVNRKEFVT